LKRYIKIFLFLLIIRTGTAGIQDDNYIFIVIADGFKAEYLNRGLTPNINKLGEKGKDATEVKNVYPTVSYTNNVSMFTGCYPENHGIISNVFKNPITDEYFDGRNPESYNNPKWYDREFIWTHAEKFGILSNIVCVPGGSVMSEYKAPYYFLDRNSKAIPKFRLKEAFDRLDLPEKQRPQLTVVYFDDIDDAGHRYGTNSDNTNEAIKEIDNSIGIIIDSLTGKNLLERTNIIFISTHGMMNINKERVINIKERINDDNIAIINQGTYCFLYMNEGMTGRDSLMKHLQGKEEGIKIYDRNSIPGSMNLGNHPYFPDVLIAAESGSILTEKNDFTTYGLKGVHGYTADNPEMNGVFIASGPNIAESRKVTSVRIIDIFPMLCEMLQINITNQIDGNIENIKQLLK